MVLFSCWLLGLTPVRLMCESVVMVWLISGESPFSSKACSPGKLGSLLNKTGCFLVGLPVEPPRSSLLLSPFGGVASAFNPSLKPKVSPSFMLLSELCKCLNFGMHSSIRAGGAFLWGTVRRPQNNTSNLLAKVVEDTFSTGATAAGVVEREAAPVSDELLPALGILLERAGTSTWRAELFPTCLNTLMISATCRISQKGGKCCNNGKKTLKMQLKYVLIKRLWVGFSVHYFLSVPGASVKGTRTISGTLDCGVDVTGSEHAEPSLTRKASLTKNVAMSERFFF